MQFVKSVPSYSKSPPGSSSGPFTVGSPPHTWLSSEATTVHGYDRCPVIVVYSFVNRHITMILILRPGLDAVLHMSRIEFNELSSYEVRRLNQFETADVIRIRSAVLHAWLSRE